jgi:hypothetical protein
VADLATRVDDVLQGWAGAIDGVRKPLTQTGSLTFADVDNVALLRVITRELSQTQRARGVVSFAGVSSGGGNPILQSWTKVEGVEDVWFIADARFEDHRVHLRFGVDGEPGTAEEVWRIARTLDDAITVDAFAEFVERTSHGNTRAVANFQAGGRGRPQARGDWNAVIASGKRTAGTNPGFLRDGLTRLECGVRISKDALNSWSLKVLMDAVHDHLRSAWAAAQEAKR